MLQLCTLRTLVLVRIRIRILMLIPMLHSGPKRRLRRILIAIRILLSRAIASAAAVS